jgi:hypothetical protein
MFSLLSRMGQCAQFVVPLALERVGDKTVVRIHQHESPLCEIGLHLRTLYRATAQLISLFLPGFDLSSDLERQLEGGMCQFLDDQKLQWPRRWAALQLIN